MDATRRRSLAPALTIAAICVGFTAYAFLVDFSVLGWQDEAWFLDVVHRVAAGDALYKDVWYGSTPLAVYVALAPVAAFGAEVAWVKLLVALSCGVSAALAVLLARRLGVRRVALLVLALAAYVSCAALAPALYQPLATPFLLACFLATVAWLQDGGRRLGRLAVAAGVAAGLALSTKYTVGLLGLGAAVVTLLVSSRVLRTRLIAVILAVGSCAVTTAVVVTPALAQGPRAFWTSAFGGKGAYVDRGSISFFGGMRYAATRVTDPSFNASIRFVAIYWTALFVVTLAALAGTAWVARRRHGERRREAVAVLLFTAGGLGTAYPRFDYSHLLFTSPLLLVGAAFALTELGGGLRVRYGTAFLAAALAAPVLVLLARPPALLVAGGERVSGLPHFRAALVDEDKERAAARGANTIRAAAEGRPLFLLSGEAGLYYLVSGVRNPTRYDYPIVTTMGSSGQDELVRDLTDGRLRRVCLDDRLSGKLAPGRLIAFIRRDLRPGPSLGPCRLLRVRAARSG